MEMKVNYMILKDSIIINYDSRTFTVNRKSDEYFTVLDLIKAERFDEIPAVVDVQKTIEEYVPDGSFVVHKGCVYADGKVVSGYIGEKLLEFAEASLPYEPLLNLWRRIKDNPSNNSKDQLYRFLESCKIPITDEGKFIAYKSVNSNMTDHHTGRFQYKLNEPAVMDRNHVEDRPEHGCGAGLHVGSYSYASSFGGGNCIVLEMEVDPADVVSVPNDHSNQKLRACKILPVAVCEREYSRPIVITGNNVPEEAVEAVELTGFGLTTSEDNIVTIARNLYTMSDGDANLYSHVVSSNKYDNVVELRPSKAAKAIKAVGVVMGCARFESEGNVCYVGKYAEKVVLFVPQGYVLVTETEANDYLAFLEEITIGNKTYLGDVVSSFEFTKSVDNNKKLSKSKYPVAFRTLNVDSQIVNMRRAVDASDNDVVYFLVELENEVYIQYK